MILHILVDEERLECERLAHRADEAELFFACEDEATQCCNIRGLHRLEQEHVRPPGSLGPGRDEEVGTVVVDGVDFLQAHETADLDRATRVMLLDRLEIGVLDQHELALCHLPAADELVGLDIALVDWTPALLLDRRGALTVQHAERHIRLAGDRLRRRREANGDVDESEAD